MTQINVTTSPVEVSVAERDGVVVVTAYTEGPQGPAGSVVELGQLPNVDTSNAVDGSVLVYHQAQAKFKADSVWTTSTLSDGGNF